MNISFPSMYKKIEKEYLDEFKDTVYTVTENVYRQEILKLFEMEEYDDIINDKIQELYDKVKTNKNIITLIELLKCDDEIMAFMLLFSYDYFYLFLPCLKGILEETEVDISNLVEIISSN
jgi:hypothetical protein